MSEKIFKNQNENKISKNRHLLKVGLFGCDEKTKIKFVSEKIFKNQNENKISKNRDLIKVSLSGCDKKQK